MASSAPWRIMSSLSSWWTPANYLDAEKAEKKLIQHCLQNLASGLLHCERRAIAIDYRITHHVKSSQSQPNFLHTLYLKATPGSLPAWQKLSLSNNVDRQSRIAQSEKSTNFDTQHKNSERVAPIVLCHGYGSGGAVFLPCVANLFTTLSSHDFMPAAYIVDWLGCGLSSRPRFNCQNAAEAEAFFIDSLEQWRKEMNIEKMVLCAHSLGAYMCALYAMKYPQHIEHLVLISPVGIPEKPDNAGSLGNNPSIPWHLRMLIRWFLSLWRNGYTPSDVLRWFGPKGKDFLHWVIEHRLFRLNSAEQEHERFKQLLTDYLYHTLALKGMGSGEYALNKILMPGAWAYNPLCHRMSALKQLQKEHGFAIDFIYGEHDWMSSDHALQLEQNDGIDATVHTISNSGHQMMLENHVEFGEMLGTVIANGAQKCIQ